MTKETKMDQKRAYYREVREKASQCLLAMGVPPPGDGTAPDSWNGMMSMVEYLFDHEPTAAEKAGALGAWARWNAADVECGKYDRLAKLDEIIQRETAAQSEHESAAAKK